MELPPSLVSSASLLVAIRKDLEASLQPGVNLNQVIARLTSVTSIKMVRDIILGYKKNYKELV
jgi:hypothetical protein